MCLHHRTTAFAAFRQRQTAQCAHEGNRVIGLHRLVEAPLFGQVADLVRLGNRIRRAEQKAFALVGIDDPQQHPQGGCLARAIRSQNPEYAAFGDRQVNAVHGGFAIESLDDIAGLYGELGVGRVHLRLSYMAVVFDRDRLCRMTS